MIFRQAQNKLKRELAYTSVGGTDASVPEASAAADESVNASSSSRLANLFRRGSRSRTTQSVLCVLL